MCLHPDGHVGAYSKLLLASEEQVLGLLLEEKEALRAQLSVEEDDAQACFIQSALHQLQVHTHSCTHMRTHTRTLKQVWRTFHTLNKGMVRGTLSHCHVV